jgi:ubiquinone biosynthesis protein COQ9
MSSQDGKGNHMSDTRKSEADHIEIAREKLLAAALDHVVFDGWSAATLSAAIEDSGVDAGLAAQAFPRGAIDLALAFHRSGDQAMLEALEDKDWGDTRFRDRIAGAVRLRLEQLEGRKEEVRRATAFFALPTHMSEGAAAIWATVDHIWNALGDTSDDVNWYSKRATLSAVYSATVLYWLGDDSEGHQETWAFLDRRIDDVMGIEKAKAKLREVPIAKDLMAAQAKFFDWVKAPKAEAPDDLPGRAPKSGARP